MNQVRSTAAVACLFLGACGGGGGGGGGGVSTPSGSGSAIEVPFTSFAALQPNQTVVMDGVAVTASGTQVNDTTITSANLNPIGGGTTRLTYDAGGGLKIVDIRTPQSSVLFNRDTPGHTLGCEGAICFGENATASLIAIEASAAEWNYQSFGVWAVETGPGTWAAGAMSVGAPTPGTSLPTADTFLFTGVASGFYADSSGTPFFTVAGMNASVNFGTRNIAFSTSGTNLIDMNTAAEAQNLGLNITGDFSYAQGVNSFSGNNLTTANGQLSGQGSGRFYGPAAQEIGGVYSLQGVGGTMLGGFGGKR